MSIFLFGCMLTGKIPSTLMHVVIILLLKCKSKDPADVNNYRPIAIATALSKVPVDCRQPIWFQVSTWTGMDLFALKQTVDFYHNQNTPVLS